MNRLKNVGVRNAEKISHQKIVTRQPNLNNVAAIPCKTTYLTLLAG